MVIYASICFGRSVIYENSQLKDHKYEKTRIIKPLYATIWSLWLTVSLLIYEDCIKIEYLSETASVVSIICVMVSHLNLFFRNEYIRNASLLMSIISVTLAIEKENIGHGLFTIIVKLSLFTSFVLLAELFIDRSDELSESNEMLPTSFVPYNNGAECTNSWTMVIKKRVFDRLILIKVLIIRTIWALSYSPIVYSFSIIYIVFIIYSIIPSKANEYKRDPVLYAQGDRINDNNKKKKIRDPSSKKNSIISRETTNRRIKKVYEPDSREILMAISPSLLNDDTSD